MIRILFVCLGNICRSPLAEGIFRHHAHRIGLREGPAIDLQPDLLIDSAGTGHWHVGAPPDPRSVQVAAKHGIDIAALRARQVTADDFHDFDYVLGMDRDNLKALAELRPETAAARVDLLLNFAADTPVREVPDPYYFRDMAGFERVYNIIERGVLGLLDHLHAEHFAHHQRNR